MIRAEVLRVPDGADRFLANTESAQNAVTLKPLAGVSATGAELRATLPQLSWAVIELEVTKN